MTQVEFGHSTLQVPQEVSVKDSKTGTVKSPWVLVLVCLIVSGLAFVSYRFWDQVNKRFPKVEVGSYVGTVAGNVLGRAGQDATLFVERLPGSAELDLVVMQAGYPMQRVAIGSDDSASTLPPVAITGPNNLKLTLFGSRVAPGVYEGLAVNQNNDARGSWRITQAPSVEASGRMSADQKQTLDLWLRLKFELAGVLSEISAKEEQLPKIKTDTEQLSAVVAEGTELKRRAGERYAVVLTELRQLRQRYAARSAEVKRLEATFSVATRVTNMGKLVSLARESLERDWRWMDTALRRSASDLPADKEAAFERAQRVKALKEQIADEEDRIARLR